LSSDFIFEAKKTLKRISSVIDPLWLSLIAYIMLSSVIGKKICIKTTKGTLKLNLFILLIAPSGLGNKTIIANNFVKPILRQFSKIVGVKILFPSDFTTEGLKQYIENKTSEDQSRPNDFGLIQKDELTKLFKDIYHKNYLTDQMEVLCFIYDGVIPSYVTKKDGEHPENDVCISLLSCSTPYLLKVMPISIFSQGLGNRFFYVVSLNPPVVKEDPHEFFLEFKNDHLLDDQINKLADMLADIYRKICNRKLFFSEQASRIIIEYEHKNKTVANELNKKDLFNNKSSYYARLAEFAMKISALEAINRICTQDSTNDDLIDVEEIDAQKAVNFVDECLKQFENLLNLWDSIQREERSQFRNTDKRDIVSIIADNGGMISMTELRRKSAITSEKLLNILTDLYSNGEVRYYQGKANKSKTGAATKYIVLKSINPKIPEYLSPIENLQELS
jgi:hypothetical protein